MSGRTLLIGGTGFLGSYVASLLAPRRPIVLVRPTSDRAHLPAGVELREGSLESLPDLQDVETVVYCASMGFGHVPALLRQLHASTVRRAVFVSTTAIYTSLPTRSRAVRLQAEDAVMASQFDWTILRPTMIYGSARDRNISKLLRYLARWPVFPLCADALWQPIYVEDLATAVVAALDSSASRRTAYNLAGREPLRFSELVRTAARAVGRNVALVRVPLEAAVLAARLSRVVSTEQVRRLAEDKAFDYSAATRDFGFAPRPFSEGVALEAQALGLARHVI